MIKDRRVVEQALFVCPLLGEDLDDHIRLCVSLPVLDVGLEGSRWRERAWREVFRML